MDGDPHDEPVDGDSESLVSLTYAECLALLRMTEVGRIAVISDPFPIVFPVNYRLVEDSAGSASDPGHAWIAIRTRPGNVIDRAPRYVGFEIDGIDALKRGGWSVLVAGTLEHLDPDAAGFRERFDPAPWAADGRDAWLAVHPVRITGRRLPIPPAAWAFSPDAYL